MITGTWGNTTESYRSTDPVYSTVAGETYDFMAKIPATKLTGRKVRFTVSYTHLDVYKRQLLWEALHK